MIWEFVFVLIQVTVFSEITFNEDLCRAETTLCEKCPNTNKKILRIRTLFTQCQPNDFHFKSDREFHY